jgi:hypothetical protein
MVHNIARAGAEANLLSTPTRQGIEWPMKSHLRGSYGNCPGNQAVERTPGYKFKVCLLRRNVTK